MKQYNYNNKPQHPSSQFANNHNNNCMNIMGKKMRFESRSDRKTGRAHSGSRVMISHGYLIWWWSFWCWVCRSPSPVAFFRCFIGLYSIYRCRWCQWTQFVSIGGAFWIALVSISWWTRRGEAHILRKFDRRYPSRTTNFPTSSTWSKYLLFIFAPPL